MSKEIIKRTMEFIGEDDWGRHVYKCLENNILWKDINAGKWGISLYSCNNNFDGEPNCPIREDIEITYINNKEQVAEQEKFDYQLLSRLQSDCKYYLGNGNRCKNHLWAGDEVEQIKKMKELYNSFDDNKKPEWITLSDILQYEKLMVNND